MSGSSRPSTSDMNLNTAADQSPTSEISADTSVDSLWETFSTRLLSDSFLDKFLLALEQRRRVVRSSSSPVAPAFIKTSLVPGQNKQWLNKSTTLNSAKLSATGSLNSQNAKQTAGARGRLLKIIPAPVFQAVGNSPMIRLNKKIGDTLVSKTSPPTRTGQNVNNPQVISISLQPPAHSVPTATTARTIFQFSGKMNAAEIKVKCKDFLSALLRCANQQSKSVRDYVRTLIQKLVDAKMEPEEFSKKLNSSRPELVPFLKQSLPLLRHALAKGQLSVDGIRPPTLFTLTTSAGTVNMVSPSKPPEHEREYHPFESIINSPVKRKNQQDTTENKRSKTMLGDSFRSTSLNSPPTEKTELLATTINSCEMTPPSTVPLEPSLPASQTGSPLRSPRDASVSSSTDEGIQSSLSNPHPPSSLDSQEVERATTIPSTSAKMSSLVSIQSVPISSTSCRRPKSLERSGHSKEEEMLNLCSQKSLNAEEATRLRILASDKNVNMKCTDLNGYPPLLVLCKNNQSNSLYPSLKALLKRKDIDLIHCNEIHQRVSALTLLCRFYPLRDLIDCVRLLIRRGLSVDLKEKDERNSLYLLCQFYPNDDLIDIARLLVYNTVEFQSALMYEFVLRFRKLFKESELLKVLLQPLREGLPGSNLQPNHKEMKLSELCSRESLQEEDISLLRLLAKDIEVDVNLPCLTNLCPLLLVCSSNRSESLFDCVEGLLQRNSLDVQVKDSNNWNALIIVCMFNGSSKLLDIIRLFIQCGISVRATSKSGWGVLSQSLINLSLNNHDHPDFVDIVRFLLESGISSMDEDDNKELRLGLLREKIAGGNVSLSNLENVLRLLEEYRIIINIKN